MRPSTKKWVSSIAGLFAMSAIISAHGANHSLRALIDSVAKGGLDAQLPARLSVILGVAAVERATAVKQAMVRDGHKVHTFNVSTVKRDDVVIFTYDEQTRVSKAYLVSPEGELRKAVSYQPGEPAIERAPASSRSDFSGELKYWTDYEAHPARSK